MDSAIHTQFTGAPATIARKPGGEFSVYGGQLTGKTLELKPNERIVQQWRGANWVEGHVSLLTFDLAAVDGGRQTHLSLTHKDVAAGTRKPEI